MSISSVEEYDLTRSKLEAAQRMLARLEAQNDASPGAAASHSSLRTYANQLFEELRRYEIGHGLKSAPQNHFASVNSPQ